ncbi:protein-tyrosine sulfotransferase isoform X4 [Malania oleifera]|uniref:protein-tyrosine sulfotransferase isoform X4 n=1 Tax=Malania oleifera TaxID=397392 RepID=UPI0025ADECE2|nr:protein-tyrosine sulfotransferase isoform X4 [Malania oleifera]
MSTRSRKSTRVGIEMSWMDLILKWALVLMLLGLDSTFLDAFHIKDDFGHCESTVKKWASSSVYVETKEDNHTLQELLFFIHVPRTGGRTYFHCFLRKLYSSNLECPRSYDKLRVDPSKPNCRLLVTHDDYSMMSKLPKKKTSVVTILRNPVDRVFSTYEFSVEVAARFLVHPNLSSATQMVGGLRSKSHGVSTLNIWPWKYLVPWMREDLFARVAGLTNNSYQAESHEVRHCAQKYQTLGQYVLKVAKRRLDKMLYVGLTEDHRESATMFANVVGAQVISQLTASGFDVQNAANNKSEQNSFADSEPDSNPFLNSTTYQKDSEIASTESVETKNENMTVGKLMGAYEECVANLRKVQARRRVSSFKRIAPANFSKKARLEVPEVVLQQIISLNSLDVELYKHAQDIFARQHKQILQTFASIDRQESVYNSSYGAPSWKVLSIAIFIALQLFLVFLFVNARRRTLKLKM